VGAVEIFQQRWLSPLEKNRLYACGHKFI